MLNWLVVSDVSRAATDAASRQGISADMNVPGRPTTIHLPGHTTGHCAFWVPNREVLFVGDALATMDPLRGTECEPAPIRIGNTDHDQVMESVRDLTELKDVTLLPGHGKPWEGHLGEALATGTGVTR